MYLDGLGGLNMEVEITGNFISQKRTCLLMGKEV